MVIKKNRASQKGKGRRGYGASVLFKCLLLVFLGYASSIRHMVRKLKHDPGLAKVIGLEVKDGKVKVPDRTTFSKFISGKIFGILLNTVATYGLAIAGVLADAAYDYNRIGKKANSTVGCGSNSRPRR